MIYNNLLLYILLLLVFFSYFINLLFLFFLDFYNFLDSSFYIGISFCLFNEPLIF